MNRSETPGNGECVGEQGSGRRAPVYLLGLDAADWERVQSFCASGDMPHLAALLSHGARGVLASPADGYAGGVWPDFYTGKSVAHHGIYHNKLWNAGAMRVEVPTDEWLPERPFHEDLSAQGLRICAIDVPMILGAPRSVNGVYLGGWGTHDLISQGSWPPELWSTLMQQHGAPRMPTEHFGAQRAEDLQRLEQQLLDATRQVTDLACEQLTRESPDYACVVLGAAHRAGHYLWDTSQLAEPPDDPRRQALTDALRRIYRGVDEALGRLLATVPPDATTLVFAVHGMQANPGWADLGAEIMDQLLAARLGKAPRKGLLYQLRRRLPFHWVRPVLTRLPPSVSEGLVKLWSRRMYDWSTTPCFPMPMDQAGYLRINLRGREAEGIVAPEDYTALCDEVEQAFRGVHDAATGEALVGEVRRPWAEAPASAAARDVLPDLLLQWGQLSLAQTRELRHHDLPNWSFRVPARAPSGRSGNHVGRGWFVASGPGIAAATYSGYHIRDLAPTVYDLLELPPRDDFEGHRIPLRWDAP